MGAGHFVMVVPEPRQLRRCQAGHPLIGLSEFPEPPLGARLFRGQGRAEGAWLEVVGVRQLPVGGVARVVRAGEQRAGS